MSVWFTADEHIGHKNVLHLMDRPYRSEAEMEDDFVARHNAVVGKGDRVYHLGDVSFKDHRTRMYIEQLNGQHHLIRGNHDAKKQTALWAWEGLAKMVKIDGHLFYCSHYAHRTWPQSHYGAYHCYGHSHGMIDPYFRSMDVGVDGNNFTPVHYTEVIAKREDCGFVDPHERNSLCQSE